MELGDLKNMKFSNCVKRGLEKLEDGLKLPSSGQAKKIQECIIDDYIFNFRENKQSLSPIDELEIVRCISQHIAQIVDPAARNSIFMTLFPVVGTDTRTNIKIRLLSSLVSLALVTHNVAVLDATAVWMQQLGCLSQRCGQVCQTLLNDYFQKKDPQRPHFGKALKALPNATPLFTANIITALAQLFAKIGTTEFCDPPPHYLVEVVIDWLRSSPNIPLSPLTSPVAGISLPMVPILPLGPLAKWSVEAPFLYENNTKEENEAFSELHLLLLQTLQSVTALTPPIPKLDVICAEHIRSIVDVLCLRLENRNGTDAASQLAMNRLAQITLVALDANCVTGRESEMWSSLRRLPSSTRLLKNLINRNVRK